jgi:hypothetical protein
MSDNDEVVVILADSLEEKIKQNINDVIHCNLIHLFSIIII